MLMTAGVESLTDKGTIGLRGGNIGKLYPVLGALTCPEATREEEPKVDNPEEIYKLEIRYRALEFIRCWYMRPGLDPVERALAPLYEPMHSVTSLNNQFAARLIPCFLDFDITEGLEKFRGLNPSTADEEMALLLTNGQFVDLYSKLADYLLSVDGEIHSSLEPRLEAMRQADKNEFNDAENRSLEFMLREGMTISFDIGDDSARQRLAEAYQIAGEGVLPVTEYVKNDRILQVNGFTGSKLSLAIHDFMDHIWTFDVIQRSGLLDRYSKMFASVGNPELTDIFRREGEMVASIAFGVRLFQTMPSAFEPLMDSFAIEEHLDSLFVEGTLEERHMHAYRAIKGMRRGSVEWQSLGFSFSNYITELDEQRRKHGKIKQRDPATRRLVGELDPFSPDYMCFFIDAHREIVSPENKHRDDLFRIHILIEECLHAAANNGMSGPHRILLSGLRDIDFRGTVLSANRLQWMRNNYGFTANKDVII